MSSSDERWPELPLEKWQGTYDTLHMLAQIVGKLRLALSPRINHWWEATFYVSPCGLTTSSIPCGYGSFEAEFDFIRHRLAFRTSSGGARSIPLTARPVADYYREIRATVASLGIDVRIWPMPVEVPNPIRFDRDREHASYDPEYANRFWRILVSVSQIFEEFRARFIGKVSPVHFFWGSFDLAVTRFSGRRAPPREGADAITREAYSHEVLSAGFWPGGGGVSGAAFYSYAAPEPPGFSQATAGPAQAFYDPNLHEFLLMYDAVRTAASPRAALLEFLQSTYEAGADLAKWDRQALERGPAEPAR